jgi:tRNA (guanine37-N1)-methyltransferase
MIDFHFLTLFPELFSGVLESSLMGKAQKKGLVAFHLTQIREFAKDKHRTTDDTPYGGGEGMLLKPDVLFDAWKSVLPEEPIQPEISVPDVLEDVQKVDSKIGRKVAPKVATILLSPQGEMFSQEMAKELATYSQLILVCGHYEGVDERFIDLCVDREVSVGDYVLTGGELPALVIADAVTRLVPGVIGNERSVSEDSLERGLLKYPQYTRPRVFQDLPVPDVLLGGDHQAIARWRQSCREERTRLKRPDLWDNYVQKRNK